MDKENQDSPNQRETTAAANGWLVIVLTALVAVLLVKSVFDSISNRPNYADAERVVTPRGALGEDEKATIEVFEKVAPSVVYIRTKGYQQTFDGSVASQEFASGTGFVWDEKGHIITNLHVVKDSLQRRGSQLEVQLADNRIFDAEFVGAVSKHDIAVLRIDAEPSQLVPITVGSSEDLKVGQKVLAIGNPFGFDRTLSTGIIGGLNRTVGTDDENILAGMIQTDAAINPGNSGGPLLDSAGRLIGVNSAIVSTSGASAGLGFAVAVNDVYQAVGLVFNEAASPPAPSMGVAILDTETARENGIPENLLAGGLVVLFVYPDTPAALSGLQGCRRQGNTVILGDQITAIDGQPTSTFDELKALLGNHQAGDTITLDVVRGTRRFQVPLTLEARKVLL
jgi:S1-C subfamily serine protease